MTDVMSEAFGRELVARTTFEKEAVWLPLLAVHHMNAGETVVSGKTFTDCVIEGPAVMASVGKGVSLEQCNLGAAADVKNLMLKPMGEKIIGAIGFDDCRFVRCRFVQVGFTGPDAYLTQLSEGLRSLAVEAGVQA